jgi:hypothetical protein
MSKAVEPQGSVLDLSLVYLNHSIKIIFLFISSWTFVLQVLKNSVVFDGLKSRDRRMEIGKEISSEFSVNYCLILHIWS